MGSFEIRHLDYLPANKEKDTNQSKSWFLKYDIRSRAYWMGMLEMWKITNFPIFYLDLYVLLFGVLGFALPDSFRINADNDTFMSLIFLLTVHYAIQVHQVSTNFVCKKKHHQNITIIDFEFGIFLQRLKRLGPYTCISILGFDFRMELLYWNRVTFNIVITYQVPHKRLLL